MKFSDLFAKQDEINNAVDLTGDEVLKVEIPFKKTVTVHKSLFRKTVTTESTVVRHLNVQKVFYDSQNKAIVLKCE